MCKAGAEPITKEMTHGSLFSGIRGFELAAKWMGWQNIFSCEIDEFCNKVGKYYFPETIIHHDIRETDFTIYRGTIDILTGGFPCQPFSLAGKRKGKEDDRHLWPEMLRAIREIQPGWIVGENVFGIVNWSGGMVFDEVQASLEVEGYEVQPFILPACGVNAPHRRDRVWIIAYSIGNRGVQYGGGSGNLHYRNRDDKEKESKWNNIANGIDCINNGNATNSCGIGLERSLQTGKYEGQKQQIQERGKACKYLYENGRGVQFKNFPTQPPLCSRNDGLSDRLVGITFPKHRQESIKGYGNAIVPQVAFQIFKAIEEYIK